MPRTITLSPRDIDAIARVVQAEAGNQGPQGMAAVAGVIMNRVSMPDRFGSSVDDVLNAPKQFSPINGLGSWERLPPANDQVRSIVQQTAAAVQQGGSAANPAGTATHFLNPTISDRSNVRGWGSQLANSFRVGAHVFGTPRGENTPGEYAVRMDDAGRAGFYAPPRPPGTIPYLTQGNRSDSVKDLQRQINDVLGTNLKVDGVFGPRTREALRDFQSAAYLRPDGVFGPRSREALTREWTALQGRPAEGAPEPAPAAQAAPAPTWGQGEAIAGPIMNGGERGAMAPGLPAQFSIAAGNAGTPGSTVPYPSRPYEPGYTMPYSPGFTPGMQADTFQARFNFNDKGPPPDSWWDWAKVPQVGWQDGAPVPFTERAAEALQKFPTWIQEQAKPYMATLPQHEAYAAADAGKLTVNEAIDKYAPFGTGWLARSMLNKEYPGGIEGLQRDLAPRQEPGMPTFTPSPFASTPPPVENSFAKPLEWADSPFAAATPPQGPEPPSPFGVASAPPEPTPFSNRFGDWGSPPTPALFSGGGGVELPSFNAAAPAFSATAFEPGYTMPAAPASFDFYQPPAFAAPLQNLPDQQWASSYYQPFY